MFFLNITDPVQRIQMVNEFLKTKRNIQLNNLSERLGNIEMKREMAKMFAPITESQQKTLEVTEKGFADAQKALTEIPKQLAIELPTSLKTVSNKAITTILPTIGSTAANYLKTYLGKSTGDTKYSIYTKVGQFYIGNKEVKIDDNDIIVDEIKYKGTPGLWSKLVKIQKIILKKI